MSVNFKKLKAHGSVVLPIGQTHLLAKNHIMQYTSHMRKSRLFLWIMAILLALYSFKPDTAVTVFMIGDSTMANKSLKNGNKERGWGMALPCYFDEGIRVENHAVNGRSSKSFIDEGRWQKVVDRIKPGDYVFIQFGHNDEKPKPDRHTDPGTGLCEGQGDR